MIYKIMSASRKFDSITGMNTYKIGRIIYLKLIDLLNVFYRFIDRFRLIFLRSDQPIRLHLGCGEVFKEGYLNIDSRSFDKVDIVIAGVSSISIGNS